MRILLAVDGSGFSRKAATWLATHISNLRGRQHVTVVNVHPPVPYRGASSVLGREAVERYHREECEASLRPAEAILSKAGLDYDAVWLVGDPAETVAELARKRKADVIVMGSHGEGALAGLLLGSVVTKVLARSKVPVLVVR